jgi:hypothetical protein
LRERRRFVTDFREYADPYPATPGELEKRIEEVRQRIRKDSRLAPGFREVLEQHAHSFVEGTIIQARGSHFYGKQLGWTSFVIRNEHLDIVAFLGAIATALCTLTAEPDKKPESAAVPLAIAVASAGLKARQKGGLIDPADYQVLLALKKRGPSKIRWIADDLSAVSGRSWSEKDVEAALRRLGSVRLKDGSLESFAVEGNDGLWSANGC